MSETGHYGPERAWHYGTVDRCRAYGCRADYLRRLASGPSLDWVPEHLRNWVQHEIPQERPDWSVPHPDLCGAWRAKWNQTVSDNSPRCELPPDHVAANGRQLSQRHIGRHPSGRWCTWDPFKISGGNR